MLHWAARPPLPPPARHAALPPFAGNLPTYSPAINYRLRLFFFFFFLDLPSKQASHTARGYDIVVVVVVGGGRSIGAMTSPLPPPPPPTAMFIPRRIAPYGFYPPLSLIRLNRSRGGMPCTDFTRLLACVCLLAWFRRAVLACPLVRMVRR